MKLLSPALVEAIHDEVLNPGELAGRAQDKSLVWWFGNPPYRAGLAVSRLSKGVRASSR